MGMDLKAYCREELEGARKRYLDDLDAMTDAIVTTSSGGQSRSPIQFTYEIVVVNRRLTKRLRGEDPGPFDPAAFKDIPSDFSSPEACKKFFSESIDEMITALAAIPGEEILKEIVLPSGSTNPFKLACFAAVHITYHDGQLNLLQAQAGDPEIHWS